MSAMRPDMSAGPIPTELQALECRLVETGFRVRIIILGASRNTQEHGGQRRKQLISHDVLLELLSVFSSSGLSLRAEATGYFICAAGLC